MVSLLASLTAAKSIGAKKSEFDKIAKEKNRQIVFAYFHGEPLGYIGSSRMIYDFDLNEKNLTVTKQPTKTAKILNINDIKMVIELQQFAFDTNQYVIHEDYDI